MERKQVTFADFTPAADTLLAQLAEIKMPGVTGGKTAKNELCCR
jgi:hypothetical protein